MAGRGSGELTGQNLKTPRSQRTAAEDAEKRCTKKISQAYLFGSSLTKLRRVGNILCSSRDPGEMANTTRRVGVVLFQLGWPDTLEAIGPFLFNPICAA